MTRNEAIEKAFTVTCGVNSNDIVNVLEALGLIKFDKEITFNNEETIFDNAIMFARANAYDTVDFVKHLDVQGYKIVKK